MKKFKGTKGEWNVVFEENINDILSGTDVIGGENTASLTIESNEGGNGTWKVHNSDRNIICPIVSGLRSSRVMESMPNAKLIAAAPELLEACIEFVRKVECGEARSKRSYKQMKEAIEKALS